MHHAHRLMARAYGAVHHASFMATGIISFFLILAANLQAEREDAR